MTSGRDRRACEFRLLRYVPDAVRNEYVHIGVILREQGSRTSGRGPFTRDWRRVRCLDPEADTALLEGMEGELRRRFQAEPDGNLMRLLDESLSLSVQMTEPKAYLAESLPAGMEELMRLYVEPPPRERVPRLEWARGDPGEDAERSSSGPGCGICCGRELRLQSTRGRAIHCGSMWVTGRMESIRMFHAVSLEPGVEMAKVLAFSAAGLRAGVERVEKAELELTAVIEPAARLGATRRRAGAAGDVPLWGGDDGGAPDPGADYIGPGPGGGDSAAGAAGVNRSSSNQWTVCGT